jgi:ABC-type protease/lipase transport system fused ATPase/permease subunit
MLLGICGPSGSHKSSLTRYLKSAYGFKRIHFQEAD